MSNKWDEMWAELSVPVCGPDTIQQRAWQPILNKELFHTVPAWSTVWHQSSGKDLPNEAEKWKHALKQKANI